MDTKICSKCGLLKTHNEYFKDAKSKDGLQSQCKQCKSSAITAYLKSDVIKERDREKNRVYGLKKYYKNRLSYNFSRRMRKSLKGLKENKHWENLVDFSLEELKSHLESLFVDGMNWDNYGTVWHIDHKVPIANFVIGSYDSSEFKQCWSLQNLQPLFVLDNLKKGKKTAPSSSGKDIRLSS